jgi:hypothetical protein
LPKPVRTHSDLTDAVSETLANLWRTTLGESAADALCLVEQGIEPLTPCMPCSFGLLPHPQVREPEASATVVSSDRD